MRIPTSVVVMSLITAVPFALAVRDTVKPHPKTLDEMTDAEREAHFEQEMQKEAAEEAAREAANTAKRAETYKTFFGSKPAQLGSYFTGAQLGMPVDQPKFDSLASNTLVEAINFVGEHTLDSIRISESEHCDALHSAMVAAWQDSSDGVFLDTANHQRASYHDCTVTFDRYVEVNQWIDKKGDVPVALSIIGTSADKLRETLGDQIVQDDGEVVMWNAPGLGHGQGPTHITARTENGKVIGLSINVMTDAATMDAVQARLDGLLGKGTPVVDTDDTTEYKGKVPARLTRSDDTLSLDLGK